MYLVMIENPNQLLRRLIILVITKFVVGTLLFFLRDKTLGLAILLAAVIGLIWLLSVNHRIKKNYSINTKKSLAFFHITIGTFIFSFGILVFTLKGVTRIQVVSLKLLVGLLLVLRGVYHLNKKKPKPRKEEEKSK